MNESDPRTPNTASPSRQDGWGRIPAPLSISCQTDPPLAQGQWDLAFLLSDAVFNPPSAARNPRSLLLSHLEAMAQLRVLRANDRWDELWPLAD